MKKCLVVVCIFALALTACGSKKQEKTDSNEALRVTEATTIEENATETTTVEEKIAETTAVENTTESKDNQTETNEDESETKEDETSPAIQTDLEDGSYSSTLIREASPYIEEYVSSIEFEDGYVVIDASFMQLDEGDYSIKNTWNKKSYTILTDSDTKYLSGGGTSEPAYMSRSEFVEYISNVMDSGLGLEIVIENGVAAEFGIWS